MLFFYGTSGRVIETKAWNHLCVKCGTLSATLATVFRYFHIFWIPTFPLSRKAIVVCQGCQHSELLPKSAGAPLAKRPLWSISGLILIGLLVAYGYHLSVVTKAETTMAASDPRIGDTYIFEIEEGEQKGRHGLLSLINDRGDGFEAGINELSYASAYAARQGFEKLPKDRRLSFIKPERFLIRTSDLSKFKIDDVIRDSF